MTDRERTIHKLALIAARIAVKEALRSQGIKLAYVASSEIDRAAEETYNNDLQRFTDKATEFYDEFAGIGKPSNQEEAAS